MKNSRIRAAFLLSALFLALLLLPNAVRLLTDWYWFQEIGFESIFLTRLGAQILLGVGVGLLSFGFLYLNFRIAHRRLGGQPIWIRLDQYGRQQLDVSQLLNRFAVPGFLLLSLFVGLFAAGRWLTVLQYLHGASFDLRDPILQRDLSYYFFALPMAEAALGLFFFLAVMALLVSLALYYLRGELVFQRWRLRSARRAQLHLALVASFLFVLTALSIHFIRIPELLYSSTGPLLGASYTDLHVRLPVLRILPIVALVGAALLVWGGIKRELDRSAAAALVLYFGLSVLGGSLYPAAIQTFSVAPNELVKEAPLLRHHIAATQRAWGLDGVKTRDLEGAAVLTLQDLRENASTIRNVRLWDREPLLDTFGQIQEIRTYYEFNSVDNDRYWLDGEYRQVMLSPRELSSAALPARTFINERLTFTHGMGLTLGPVNLVTDEGLPVLFIKDLPPASTVSIAVKRPEIYFGELSNDYVFANTQQKEFNYPSGDENVFTTYEGTGGVPVRSLLRKAIFAARFGSLKILLSDDITNESRALYYRNIRDRAEKALPFLRFDSDPYLVITDEGRLHWIYDAYTRSRRYPYAQRLPDGTNYVRNSVKLVIDAYDGDLRAYVADPTDPIVQTLQRIFPGIFLPLEAMPRDLRAHLRYPEDLFRVQTALYTTYHMGEPQIFYNREDQWAIPAGAPGQTQDPFYRHIIMKLPGEETEEFILMVPFTPQGKDNLSAWMVARNDGAHYGELVVYRFPKQSLIFGPRQIINRINQDTEISRQISLWDQRGSEVIRGNLLVIPIEESLLYVQPLYLRAEGGRIPELKRVVVAYENRVVMAETLEAGLALIFGERGVETARPRPPAAAREPFAQTEELVARALRHFEQAEAAQRGGDWARYGEELRRLGEVLRELHDSSTRKETSSP